MKLSRCQTEDAHLRRAMATVERVREAGDGYDVVLGETIFYPEGGGQPADRGRMGGADVIDVQRTAEGRIIHRVDSPLFAGEEVEVELDWERRFDFMQQHTAQHLITALADDEFGWPTTSFHLGDWYSAVEVDASVPGREALVRLESLVNDEIRRARDVSFRFVAREEVDADSIRSRRLPDDLGDEVRLVEIEGIDLNTCGGTHVSSTAELQSIKFLGVEPARGGVRISYLAGQRVLDWMGDELERHERLNELLSCGPEDYVDAVRKLADDAVTAQRELRSAREELSARLGRSLAGEEGPIVSAHRSEQDFKFLEAVAQAALDYDGTDIVFLTASDQPEGPGIFLLAAPAEIVDEVGDDVAEILDGRGGGRPGRYQGKAEDLSRRNDVLDILRSTSRELD